MDAHHLRYLSKETKEYYTQVAAKRAEYLKCLRRQHSVTVKTHDIMKLFVKVPDNMHSRTHYFSNLRKQEQHKLCNVLPIKSHSKPLWQNRNISIQGPAMSKKKAFQNLFGFSNKKDAGSTKEKNAKNLHSCSVHRITAGRTEEIEAKQEQMDKFLQDTLAQLKRTELGKKSIKTSFNFNVKGFDDSSKTTITTSVESVVYRSTCNGRGYSKSEGERRRDVKNYIPCELIEILNHKTYRKPDSRKDKHLHLHESKAEISQASDMKISKSESTKHQTKFEYETSVSIATELMGIGLEQAASLLSITETKETRLPKNVADYGGNKIKSITQIRVPKNVNLQQPEKKYVVSHKIPLHNHYTKQFDLKKTAQNLQKTVVPNISALQRQCEKYSKSALGKTSHHSSSQTKISGRTYTVHKSENLNSAATGVQIKESEISYSEKSGSDTTESDDGTKECISARMQNHSGSKSMQRDCDCKKCRNKATELKLELRTIEYFILLLYKFLELLEELFAGETVCPEDFPKDQLLLEIMSVRDKILDNTELQQSEQQTFLFCASSFFHVLAVENSKEVKSTLKFVKRELKSISEKRLGTSEIHDLLETNNSDNH